MCKLKEVYIVYKTDTHHSYASRDILGVCDEFTSVIELIYKQVDKEGGELGLDQEYNLESIHQTQGYSGEGEFQIETVETNKLL